MSRYSVEIKEQAQQDLIVLCKNEPKAYQRLLRSSLNYKTILKQVQVSLSN